MPSRVCLAMAKRCGSWRSATGTSRILATSPGRGLKSGREEVAATWGWQDEPADRDVQRGQGPQEPRGRGIDSGLFLGLAQRRLGKRFARFDAAAGQGDLAAVLWQRFFSERQDQVRPPVPRVEQQQGGAVETVGRNAARLPSAARARGHGEVSLRSRQRFRETALEEMFEGLRVQRISRG